MSNSPIDRTPAKQDAGSAVEPTIPPGCTCPVYAYNGGRVTMGDVEAELQEAIGWVKWLDRAQDENAQGFSTISKGASMRLASTLTRLMHAIRALLYDSIVEAHNQDH